MKANGSSLSTCHRLQSISREPGGKSPQKKKKRQCRKPSTGPAAEHGALTEVSPVSRLNFYNQPHFSNIKWKPSKVDIAWGLGCCSEGQDAASLFIVSMDDSQPCYPPPGAPLSVDYPGCVCHPPESHSVALLGTKPCGVGLGIILNHGSKMQTW